MSGDRRLVPEADNHAAKGADGIWGELTFDSVGRRSIYWRSWMTRGGWATCVWKRWIPRTNNVVRPAGFFARRR